MIANATGCSSIYGGNLPTTPWTQQRRRPRAGLVQLAVRGQRRVRPRLSAWPLDKQLELRASCSRELAPQTRRGSGGRRSSRRRRSTESEHPRQRDAGRGAQGDARRAATMPTRRDLLARRRSPGAPQRLDRRRRRLGLRHRLRRARPRARARARRQRPGARHRGLLQHRRAGVEGDAARRGGEVRRRRASTCRKKDLALQAIAYGNVYVAQIAMGADQRSRRCSRSARRRPSTGPSLILAYCHCIAHGIDMRHGMEQQDRAVASGYWPLFRYDPACASAA